MKLLFRSMLTGAALFASIELADAGEFYEKGGVAIDGYDAVAYFTLHKALIGSKDFTFTYHDSTFQFADAADRDAFAADPARYAPQYSGFCTFGVSVDVKVPSNPAAFRIIGGKLYLNYDKATAVEFDKDVTGNLSKADHNWPALQGSPIAH